MSARFERIGIGNELLGGQIWSSSLERREEGANVRPSLGRGRPVHRFVDNEFHIRLGQPIFFDLGFQPVFERFSP